MQSSRRTRPKISQRTTSTSSLHSAEAMATMVLEWEPIAPLGPRAAFHVGGVIDDVLYIHGGIREVGFNQPSNQFYRLHLETSFWEEIRTQGSPALSHHAAVVLENRYLLLIGGWDGKKRGSELYVYDTHNDKWSQLEQSGFPSGGGLSSHTANKLSDDSIIIIGREGSLRTQRRHGNAYILSGSVLAAQFAYKEYSHDVISRSGHTANVVGSFIYILGGRRDNILEKAGGFKHTSVNKCNVLSRVFNYVELRHQIPLQRFPCGRKNHVAVSSTDCILIHGGETFDGRREPIGEMLLISLKSPACFFKLDGETLKRAGHVCFAWSDRVLLHGGLSGKNSIHADLYDLKFKS